MQVAHASVFLLLFIGYVPLAAISPNDCGGGFAAGINQEPTLITRTTKPLDTRKTPAELMQSFRRLVTGVLNSTESPEFKANLLDDLSTLGIQFRRSIRPRGNLYTAASPLLSHPDLAGEVSPADFDLLRQLHEVQGLTPDGRGEWLSALGVWGDEHSALTILNQVERLLLEKEQSLEEIASAISALGMLGGPHAVTGLVAMAIMTNQAGLRHSAFCKLEDLATGGDIDTSSDDVVAIPNFARDVRLLSDWPRIQSWADNLLKVGGPEWAQRIIALWPDLLSHLDARSLLTGSD